MLMLRPMPTNGPCARISGTSTAVPAHRIDREAVKAWLQRVFELDDMRLAAMLSVVDNSQVRQRWCIFPLEYVIEPRPLEQISREYAEHAVALGREVSRAALERAQKTFAEVDLLITVSCTGVMIPSLDAHLVNLMGFRSDVRRLPITELGCAAGASALARAAEFIRAYPEACVLIIAVELPSLTFQRKNSSQANLISSILFGDGAAAAVVSGAAGAAGPCIRAWETFLFPDSLDGMGFDLKDSGFHIVLSRDVPEMIRRAIRALVDDFLARSGGLRRADLGPCVLHPGGQKLLANVEQELELRPEQTAPSWHVLREYGNQSSASVLFVLHEWLERHAPPSGARGLLAAFGPGFSAELMLLEWP
jgi:alkylresorcinol/alkylpyrone synthase